MARKLKVAAAQIGAVDSNADRAATLQRLIKLLKEAASQGAKIVLFPEVALTTFFPRFLFADDAEELENYFEHGDITQSPNTKALFDEAKALGVDISVGYAERTSDVKGHNKGYNTCIYYSASQDKILSKYRKVHLPGTVEVFDNPKAINQLEKRYFAPGDLGFQAFRAPNLVPDALKKGTTETATKGKGDPILGMMICNDRRWAESWRCYGLQGAQLVLCGYNTTAWAPDLWGMDPTTTMGEAYDQAVFHHRLVMQYNSYTNSCWSISAARCGMDDGKYDMINGSSIVDPQGKIVAESKTKGDEVVIAEIDLDECIPGKAKTFDFDRHRRVEHYGILTAQTGVVEPPLLD